ncbi:venom carboxylesterase-6-like [Colletes gigas]|uniref:venom carboxylesterase-6-like n=1 Tax=Colletes gigas TaxID=935657 RepID=UPI001C9BA5A3|nr:venom carboxylesterase-6-like [Colletes gigas]
MKLSAVLVFLTVVSSSQARSPRVETSSGGIVGYVKKSRSGREYAAFEGVPYAQPPLGKLRFLPPKPVLKWIQDLPATKKSQVCTQYLMSPVKGDRVIGCEDCLYMNIYVPTIKDKKKLLPVMFWIHGGAFQFASGNEADETLLMDRDVILVTINYRLGPFGFLSTGDRVLPGNMGLKDQSMALRWVSNNIHSFGGNSKEITLFGMSAGGSSVHYHYLSPLSAGLFQRGISISGVALDCWAQPKHVQEKALKLGALMGCPTNNLSKMIECLRERPARLISQAVGDFMYWLYNPFTPFGPVIERQKCPRPFINKSPIEIIARGEALDVPWIAGVVEDEGLYTAAEFVANEELLEELNVKWDNISPFLLDFNYTIPLEEHKTVSEMIRKHYLGSDNICSKTSAAVVQMMSDRLFKLDYAKAVRLQAEMHKSPVWTYLYSYRAQHSLSDRLSGTTKNFGVSHGDDIFLILDSTIDNTSNFVDKEMQKILLDFYTSFAIEGTPKIGKVEWKKLVGNEKAFSYLHIKNPSELVMASDNDFAQKKFWSTIKFNENKLSKSLTTEVRDKINGK